MFLKSDGQSFLINYTDTFKLIEHLCGIWQEGDLKITDVLMIHDARRFMEHRKKFLVSVNQQTGIIHVY
jgi:hypothetical protein